MKNQKIGNYVYCSGWSDELNLQQINGYVSLYKSVFKTDFSVNAFNNKFVNNIYGSSVHVLVYDGNDLIAIRSLWRNDLDDSIAFQPCDTAVADSHRGEGIFKIMTDIALEYVGDAMIYNFPNDNSRKLYLRNGWVIKRTLYKNIYTVRGFKKYCKDEIIPDKYVKWYFVDIPGIYVKKVGEMFFLLSARGHKMYIIIGMISKEVYESNIFPKAGFSILFFRWLSMF